MVITSFRERLHALQLGCRVGLLLSGAGLIGLVLLPFLPTVVTSALAFGLTFAFGSSVALGALTCPSCGHPFCGPRHDRGSTPRPAIFTRACRFCGDAPE
jgi:hypothetical protein